MDTQDVGVGPQPPMRLDAPLIEAQLLAQQLRADLDEIDAPGSFWRRMRLLRKLHYYIEKTEELRRNKEAGECEQS